jgi:hypothetical protein
MAFYTKGAERLFYDRAGYRGAVCEEVVVTESGTRRVDEGMVVARQGENQSRQSGNHFKRRITMKRGYFRQRRRYHRKGHRHRYFVQGVALVIGLLFPPKVWAASIPYLNENVGIQEGQQEDPGEEALAFVGTGSEELQQERSV